jgi:hypothetical protein
MGSYVCKWAGTQRLVAGRGQGIKVEAVKTEKRETNRKLARAAETGERIKKRF